ncbi:MAG: putative 4-hydroxybenzoate polyprenyltransferase [Planctomycetota bacterium]|nr:putative 4-hydroxybenzoate polyprenyltransferase [Planctomycetota bacterium]
MFARLRHILEMIRFSHTLFALPFALLSAALAWRLNLRAGGAIRWEEIVGILLCMVFARSVAMAFNRLVDRQIDAGNPRTAGRHLPAGILSVSSVVGFSIACSLGFVASTLLFLPNRWPLYLSVPVLAFLCGYSYAKRFTSLCHYWLGAALMLSPVAAWIALRGEVTWTPVLLGLAVFFWVGGFDIIYACQDVDFDKGRGLHSLPARMGVPRALKLALASHVAMLFCLVGLWQSAELGSLFLAGIVVVAGLLAYEHSLVRPNDLARVNVAFFNVNVIVSMGLFFVGLADVWWGWNRSK